MQDFKVNKSTEFLFIVVSVFVLLALSLVNIKNYSATSKVLGIETEENITEKFWVDFLSKNPNYVQGWVEIGRLDKATAINPNFQTSLNN
jgi:hypothetical protein